MKSKLSTLKIYMELAKIRRNPSFLWGTFEYALLNDQIFSFIRKAPNSPSFLVVMNLSDNDSTTDFSSIKQVPRKLNVVYYFDHESKKLLDKDPNDFKLIYEPNEVIMSNKVFTKPRGCAILNWTD